MYSKHVRSDIVPAYSSRLASDYFVLLVATKYGMSPRVRFIDFGDIVHANYLIL